MTDLRPDAAETWLDAWTRDLKVAAIFFTRVPIAHAGTLRLADLARAWRCAPLIGAAIGAAGGVVFAAAHHLGLPPLAAALSALAATALVTGALHEDGLSDFADGLGGRDAAQRLDIMRDSRIGAYGALALIFSVGLRAAALAAMTGPAEGFLALVAAHALSRAAIPAVMTGLPPARRDGLGADAGTPERPALALALGLAAVLGFFVLGIGPGVAAMLAGCMAAMAIAGMARRLVGGYTGDILGAVQQAAEVAILLAITATSGAR
ncbi:MAG: adenosylcobinamide-GDP ribazoletransferase [Alphaproteobacteria bacterium]|nr:adenosylcobinamide-GDP ribazoletransferase [Alphaproteobacteria bacterium]